MSCSLPQGSVIPALAFPSTHAQVVAHYIQYQRQRYRAELSWFQSQRSLLMAIREAALARDRRGKRLSHQRRLERSVLRVMWGMLRLRHRRLNQSQHFGVLFARIERLTMYIRGAGALYAYDTALRVGAYIGLTPHEVYLHAGSLEGAQKLLSNSRARSVPISVFPTVFHALAPEEMENLLCLYRRYL